MWQIEMDKKPIIGTPSFIVDEIDYFINKAYVMLIKQKVTGNNILKQGFEESPKRIADLWRLIETVEVNGVASMKHGKNEYTFDLAGYTNMLAPLSSTIKYDSETFIEAIPGTQANIVNFVHNDINRPWIPRPLVIFEKENALAYVDPDRIPFLPTYPRMFVKYVRYPQIMKWSENTEFEVEWVDEIISQAVDLALDNIESQRVQTHPQLVTANKE